MYQASKRLQAIRRQLRQMDEQYRCATEEEEPNQASSPDYSNNDIESADMVR